MKTSEVKIMIMLCRKLCKENIINGVQIKIQGLTLDVQPNSAFLGAGENPAIFINTKTYRLLGSSHDTWIENKTIVVKEHFFDRDFMQRLGIIVHEFGHSFNVSAGLTNSEANAYIYEIETLKLLVLNTDGIFHSHISSEQISQYFQSRLGYYNKETTRNCVLAKLVDEVVKPYLQPKFQYPQCPRRFFSAGSTSGHERIKRDIPEAAKLISRASV